MNAPFFETLTLQRCVLISDELQPKFALFNVIRIALNHKSRVNIRHENALDHGGQVDFSFGQAH